jgi:PKD repeat protein
LILLNVSLGIKSYNFSSPNYDAKCIATLFGDKKVRKPNTLFKNYALLLLFSFIVNLSFSQQCTLSINGNSSISVCQNQPATLTAIETGSPSIVWTSSPSGGINSGGTTLTPTLNTSIAPSTYMLIVNGNNGQCLDTVNVTINPSPSTPTFTSNPSSAQCSGTPITFAVSNQQSNVIYSWDFGDGTNGTGATISHTYNSVGNGTVSYNVIVTATFNGTGCSKSATATVIQVKQKPDASISNFAPKPFTNCGGGATFNLVVDNTSSTTNSNYNISWGDNTTTYNSPIAPNALGHQYNALGYFTLTLTVTGQNGCVSTKTYSVFNGSNPAVSFGNPGSTVELCTPYTLSFPISGTTNNPPGTIYIITKNDGTPNDTLSHPPPTNYIHNFTNTSCGATGGIDPNTFFVRIKAQNPCGSSTATIEPITTNQIPVANFTISPDTIVCINTTVTFSNKSQDGATVDNNGVCDTTTANNWSISPTTGWTLVSSTLGTNPLNPYNPTTWGSNNLVAQFNVAGVYQIKLRVQGTNTCGYDSIVKTICVQTPPTPSFIATPLTGCSPLVVNFTNTSTGLNQCGPITRLWTVTKTSFTCQADSTNDYVFISGTNSTSNNPVIRFNNQGTYSVTLQLTNKCGQFTSVPTIISVKRKPILSIAVAPNPICLGQTVTPTASTLPCDTPIISYSWTFNGGTPSSSNQQSPGPISYSSGGNKNITLTVQNACGTATANTSVLVNTPATANAGPDLAVCINSGNVQLNGIPNSGTWSGTNVTSSGVFTPSQSGTFNLIYTVGTGNCLGLDTMVMTVNPLPIISVTPSTPICIGNSITLTASGATNYSWSPGTGLNTISGSSVIASPNSTQTYTVIGTNSGTNCSASASTTVTINPLPVVNAGADQSLCNQPIPTTLIGTPTGGTWSGQNITTGGVFTPNGIGTFPVIYSYTNANNCTNKDTAIVIVINPTQPNAGTDQSACLNSGNIQLNGLPNGGTWSGTNISSTGLFTPSQAGTFSLVYTLGTSTCLKRDTIAIKVNPLPVISVTPSTSICIGNNISLSASGANSYSWSPATGLNQTTGATVLASPSTSTTYTVTGTNTITNCSATANTSISVNPLPTVNAGADQSLCNQPIPTTLIGTPTGGTWTGQNITTGGVFTPSGIGTFPVVYSYTNANNCTNKDTAIVTVINPTVPDSGLDSAVCLNSGNVQLNGTPNNGTWSGTNVSSTGVFTPSQSGTFNLIYTYGTSTCLKRDTLLMTVNTLPIISVTPSTPICIGNSITLSASGANNYSWNPGTGLNTTSGSTVTAAPTTTQTYTVIGTNSITNCSASVSTTITVNPLPTVNAGADQLLCNQPIATTLIGIPTGGTWSGQNITASGVFTPNGIGVFTEVYTVTNVNNCTNRDTAIVTVINPTIPNAGLDSTVCLNSINVVLNATPTGGNWNGTNISPSGVFTPSQTGNFNLVYTLGTSTCLKRDTLIMTVNSLPNVTVTPSLSICSGLSATLTANGATNYTWSPAAGLNTTTSSSVIASPVSTQTYTVIGTNNSTNCSASASTTVTVNSLPIVNAGADQALCNQPIPTTLIGTPTGGTWTGQNITTGGVFTPNGVGTFPVVYTYIDNNTCKATDTALITVTAPTLPNAGLDSAVCLNSGNIQLSGTPTGGNWNGTPLITPTGVFSPSQAGNYTLVYTYGASTCLKRDTILMAVNPLPNLTVTPSLSICSGLSTTLTATGANTYSWSPSTGLNNTYGATVIATPTILTTYTVIGTNSATNCSSTASTTVTINALPIVDAGIDQSLCNQPIPSTFIGTPVGGTWSGQNISPGGIFTPNGIGTFSVVYTYIDNNTCKATDTALVTVINPSVINAGNDTAICFNSSDLQFVASPAGGSWSGTSLVTSTGLFNPSQVGSFNLIYTYGAGTCLRKDSVVVVVNPLPNVTVTASSIICENDSITLTATGANTYSWNPTLGLNTIIGASVIATPKITTQYTVTGTNSTTNCTNTANSTIQVNPLPHITNTDTNIVICSDDSIAIYFQADILNTSYTWNATLNNNLSPYPISGNSNSILIPQLKNNTNSSQTVVFTVVPSAANCPGPAQKFTITINPRPIITLTPDSQVFCSGQSSVPINISSNIIGTNIIWNAISVNIGGLTNTGTGNVIPSQQLFNTSGTADSAFVIYTVSPLIGGCSGSAAKAIIQVNPKPIVNFAMNKNNGCSPLSISFASNTLVFGKPDSIVYNWGDGTPNTILYPNPIQPVWSTISHTFVNNSFSAISFTISLTAYNQCGDTSVNQTITVQPNVVNAFFTPSVTQGCEPLTVSFNDFSTGSTFTSWCFDYDVIQDTCIGLSSVVTPGTTVQHTFNAGKHIVALYITDGCSQDTAFQTIIVSPSPICDFTYNNNVCENTPVTFTQQSSSPSGMFLTAFNWQFGDGDSSLGNVVTHTYDSATVYNACLIVSASNGCTSTKCHPVSILSKPIVNFKGYDTCVNTQPIQFVDFSTGVSFYNWNFGDGNTSTLATPTNNYTTAGTYNVTLVGSTSFCSDTISHSVIIYPKPTANFLLPATYICGIPAQFQITNTSTGALGYDWNFGNNIFSTATNPNATFPSAGSFNVTLIAANQFNCYDTAHKPIDIYPFPLIQSIDIEPAEGCQPLEITVTANATNGNLYIWDFGDGTSSVSLNTPSANYTYSDTGTYTISVKVYSFLDCGDTAILSDTIKVHIRPNADFEYLANTTVEPIDGTIVFTNNSQSAESYVWNFGDGFTSNEINPIHKYESIDDFTVTLIASNHFGCEDSISKSITVFKRSLWVPNAFAPDFGGGNDLVKVWQPIGIGLRTYRAQVFNTWGELLWESTKLVDTKPSEFWDGTYHGNLAQQDVYVWKVEAIFLDGSRWDGMTYEKGKAKKTIGSVTLIR